MKLELEHYDKNKFKPEDYDRFLVADLDKDFYLVVYIGGDFIDEGHYIFGQTEIIEKIEYIKKL